MQGFHSSIHEVFCCLLPCCTGSGIGAQWRRRPFVVFVFTWQDAQFLTGVHETHALVVLQELDCITLCVATAIATPIMWPARRVRPDVETIHAATPGTVTPIFTSVGRSFANKTYWRTLFYERD